jgi:hypothetical protein
MITIQKANTILKSTTRILPPTPRTLFRNGEEGAIIDASRAETVFADDAGTTPATYGGSVARVNDIGPNGRNAFQSSSSLRPLLGRAPVAGRRNLFLRTEQLTDAYWTKNTLTLSAAAGPLPPGLAAASKIVPGSGEGGTNAGNSGQVIRTESVPTGAYTFSLFAKADEFTSFRARETAAVGSFLVVNLATGAISSVDASQFINATVTPAGDGWYRISWTSPSNCNNLNRYNFRAGPTGDGTSGILIGGLQVEAGSTATPYQRVGASALDVTEAGLAAPGYLRLDLTDDRLVHTFPSGFDGDLLIFGRKGSWVQEGVTVAAGGTLTIGPTAVPGAPTGLLAALGDIVGWLPVGRTTTQAERNKMRDYYMARGAKGFLVPGPELVTNGTFDADTAWTKGGDWTISGGVAAINTSTSFMAIRQDPAIVSGRFYDVRATAVVTSGSFGLRIGDGGQFTLTNFTSSRTFRTIHKAAAPGPLFVVGGSGGAVGSIDDISVKELRPEEDW